MKMKKAYICSPYRAKDRCQMERNLEYARAITSAALWEGLAPVAPHLYIAQCLDDENPEERARGMAAGIELLKNCDLVIIGDRYGISEGMGREIIAARVEGIDTISVDKLSYYIRNKKRDRETAASHYANMNKCLFCEGRHFHTCTGFRCREPMKEAYAYAIGRPEAL